MIVNPRTISSDLAVFIGNTLDHFDTSLYGFLAPIMAPFFFPTQDYIIQLILAYSILATSIITRPIGAIIFGRLAYSGGPVFALSYALIGVAITTVLLGCLPVYETIGYLAPISLMLIRMLRGIFASGESSIAKLYIVENKSQCGALKTSYFYNASSMLGMILASVAATIVINSQQMNAWRFCFWLGGSVGFVGVFLRLYCSNNNKHKKIINKQIFNFKALWNHKASVLKIALVVGFGHITYSVPFVFFNSFVPIVTDINLSTMLSLNNFLLIFDLIILLIIGRVVINYNPTKVLVLSSLVLSISMIPLFVLLKNSSIITVTFIRLWVVFWGVVFACPVNVWCEKLLNNLPEKYFLMGMSSAFGASIIGKTTTAVCFYLWYKTNLIFAPAVYIVILMLGAFIAILFNK